MRTVSSTKAYISFKGRHWKVPKAFRGERLAIRPLDRDGRYGIYFASHRIATIDVTCPRTVSHVSEQVSTMSPGGTTSTGMTLIGTSTTSKLMGICSISEHLKP